MKKIEDIKNIVEKVIGSIAGRKQEEQQEILQAWENILSKQQQEHTKVEGFKDETLVVILDSSAWLYQMNLRKKKILEDLQKKVPKVKTLYFKLGKTK